MILTLEGQFFYLDHLIYAIFLFKQNYVFNRFTNCDKNNY
jgi:hypothetical protein